MGAAAIVVMLAVGLVAAVKAWPLIAEALAGRRLEAAARSRDAAGLLRAGAGPAALAELARVLRRLPTAELMDLGDGLVAAAEEERGAQVLAVIAEVVERREQVLARWAAVGERRRTRGG